MLTLLTLLTMFQEKLNTGFKIWLFSFRNHAYIFQKSNLDFLMENLMLNQHQFKVIKIKPRTACLLFFKWLFFHSETNLIKKVFNVFFRAILDSWEFRSKSVESKKISQFRKKIRLSQKEKSFRDKTIKTLFHYSSSINKLFLNISLYQQENASVGVNF